MFLAFSFRARLLSNNRVSSVGRRACCSSLRITNLIIFAWLLIYSFPVSLLDYFPVLFRGGWNKIFLISIFVVPCCFPRRLFSCSRRRISIQSYDFNFRSFSRALFTLIFFCLSTITSSYFSDLLTMIFVIRPEWEASLVCHATFHKQQKETTSPAQLSNTRKKLFIFLWWSVIPMQCHLNQARDQMILLLLQF